MNKIIRYRYRVTKYNPIFRNDSGAYTKDDWTSYSDIGKSFDNNVLTIEHYLEVESLYIKAISFFCECLKIDIFSVNDFESYYEDEEYETFSVEQKELLNNIDKTKELEVKNINLFIPLILRGFIYVRLDSKENNDYYVEFGYDYYMYFGCPTEIFGLAEKINSIGLFFE